MEASIKSKIYVSPIPQNSSISQDFKLTKIDDIPCAYCGKEMKTIKYLELLFNTNPTQDSKMLENAINIGYLLSSFKKQILNFLIQTQSANGLVTDNQILKKARLFSRQYLREDILERYNEIVDIIKKSNSKRLNTYLDFNEEKCREVLLKKASYEELVKFVRKEKYLNISPYTKNRNLAKINDVISDIEERKEQYTEDYIIRRCSYRTEKEFFVNLFEKTISSVDHIIPKSKGGSDTRDNFLAVCRECNEKKGNIPLPVFMASKPDVKSNIEKQIAFLKEMIPKLITNRKLSKIYSDYPKNVNEKLVQITNGEIDLIG